MEEDSDRPQLAHKILDLAQGQNIFAHTPAAIANLAERFSRERERERERRVFFFARATVELLAAPVAKYWVESFSVRANTAP